VPSFLLCTLPWIPVHTRLQTFFASYNYVVFVSVLSVMWIGVLIVKLFNKSSLSWSAVVATAIFSFLSNFIGSMFGRGDYWTGIVFGVILFLIPGTFCTLIIVSIGKVIERLIWREN